MNKTKNNSKLLALSTDFALAERTELAKLQRQHQAWMQQEQTRLIGDTVPNVVLMLNNTRQIIYANSKVELFGKYKTIDSYLGLRPGELINCTHSTETPGGCGTTKFCSQCGATNAILTSLIGKLDAQECSIFRSNDNNPLELRVHTTPVQLNGEDFIIFSIEDIHLEKENARLLKEVQLLAVQDPLTGALNRRAFFEDAQREFARGVRYQRSLTVLMIDADKFKNINDSYGHPTGDVMLKAIALCIRANLRDLDLFARYGGDEFIALLPETNFSLGYEIAERIVEAVSVLEVEVKGKTIHPSVTAGVAAFDTPDHSLESLITRADADLLRQKQEKHYETK
jgi:diguanylate cyclase (GGDEF)-like protein